MNRLLLVEDDLQLQKQLIEWLTAEKYQVEAVESGKDALQLLNQFHFDIVVLDWNLTDINGVEVCKQHRKLGGATPILFLTGQAEMEHKEVGLDSGADDYLVKPFDVRELFVRLRTLLRRPQLADQSLSVRDASLEADTRTFAFADKKIRLTRRESAVLEFLMRHTNRYYSAQALLDSVWPLDKDVSEQSVRTCVKTLRHKLADIGCADLIKTELKSGYIVEN
jgi:DNA-binding response OmpR family regulator